MNKNFWVLTLIGVFFVLPVHAEIIILKDRTAINAKIIERDGKKIKIESNGQTVTYYLDQINSIDGKLVENKQLKESAASQTETLKAEPPQEEAPKAEDVKPIVPYTSQSKREAIKKFIDIFGTRESMSQNFERMLLSMPPAKSQEVRKILNVNEVIDNIVPLYDKHFTKSELDAYITFFSSPQGQKFLKTLPIIMSESIDVNIEYFQSRMPKDAK